MALKAYTVTDEYGEGHGVVRFARHAVTARREGANELDCEFERVSCRRSPEFDSYAEAGAVPPLVLIDHGWWMECWHCGTRLESDCEKPRESMIECGRAIYCDESCKAAREARITTQNQRFEAFRERVSKARPDLKWKRFEGAYPCITFYATFDFEGCKYGGSVRQDDDGELSWAIATGDVDAWNAYEASRAASREDS